MSSPSISPLQIKAATLTELFQMKREVEDRGIGFIKSKSEEVYCSYQQLFDTSLILLGYLQSKGLKQGDHLVFQLEDNYHFIHMFWASVMGGIVPVPIVAEEKDEYRRKLYHVLQILGDGVVIGKSGALPKLKTFAEQGGYDYDSLASRFLDIDEAFGYEGGAGSIHEAQPEDTAFIQFSSGSTGMPKGVVLTHANLITNIDAMIEGAALGPEDTIVSWMPLTHDMGLIGCHLAVTAANMVQYTMETKLFVMRPALWLDKISEVQATILTSPNFGLKFSLMAMERSRNKTFDFSSVRLIFNGAEPISVKVCDEFLEKTAKYGMKPSVMFPVYGMAEASLAVAFPDYREEQITRVVIDRNQMTVGSPVNYMTDENDPDAACYVDEGFPVKNCEFRLTDEDDNVLGEDTLGLIQIRGGNVSKGYYVNEQANRDSRTKDGWYRTGDIGFLCNGRLVVIGRLQDLVIVNGQNYFSHDLERIASKVEKVEINKVAICSVQDKDAERDKLAAFVVHKGDVSKFVPLIGKLREHFSRSIGLMLDYVIPVGQIPKTSSGKLMRYVLKQRFENGEFTELLKECGGGSLGATAEQNQAVEQSVAAQQDKQREVERDILAICQELAPEWPIGLNDNFFEYGINSLLLNQIAARLDDTYPQTIKVEDFFTHSSVRKLAAYLCETEADRQPSRTGQAPPKQRERVNGHSPAMAIIGMAANVPGAADVEQFWSNLCGGVESVGPLSSVRMKDVEAYMSSRGDTEAKGIRESGFLYAIDTFDHEFFKIMKREAIAMSPSQRLFLQTAYTAMEHAGYGGEALRSSRTGVYVGYIADLDGGHYQDMLKHSQETQTATGVLSANISGRLSYFMDFKGPSMLVDSACSSSMSALNLACQGIANGDCEQAIVGGVQLKVLPVLSHDDVGIESSDGHTRPFAEDADGTGEGEGIVSVLIKPYEQAVEDNDQIYAIIRAAHSNQDGYSVGLSAPNPEAQTALVTETLAKAELQPDHISYIEAHGTGTKLGDPIEVHALMQAFATKAEQRQSCAIGSVKSNIGHLYAASGLISIMKCSLMLTHKMIPATVNIQALNHRIPFEQSPFYVNTQFKPWETEQLPRRCGVSNFGFSGTNCHTILEEYQEPERPAEARELFPFVLSAASKESLQELVRAYVDYLSRHDGIRLSDISYTAATGRGHYPYRLALLVSDTEELLSKLEAYEWSNDRSANRYVGMAKVVGHTRKTRQWGEWTEDESEQLKQATQTSIADWLNKPQPEDRESFLRKLSELYVRGADPSWQEWFNQQDVRRVSLPTYKFKQERCWPNF
ncbi:beta-ketoacyl synthase N-terminal-like domain-containing protein [Paenibacillus daejeonensis]|uniref:beta-ketoacyl synthase N-terminal-like domain-containing protein n=1 Tax=Paenibacillus daejeonensis TaxID=135193 RepID=UPI00036C41FF|nr:beta-ketoacyl synthase N-terminal-like domain-containing protein [Paenibacillus daejeonensis]